MDMAAVQDEQARAYERRVWWRGGERGRSLRERTPPAQWPFVRQHSSGEYTFTRCLLSPPPSKGPFNFLRAFACCKAKRFALMNVAERF